MKKAAFLPALLLVPLVAAAQSDRTVPLTNTRYGGLPFGAVPTVVSNGKDTLLVATTEHGVFAGRMVEGTMKTPHRVFGPEMWNATAVWRGTHYLIAAEDTNGTGVARVDVEGRPLAGARAWIARSRNTRLASNGHTTVALRNGGWTSPQLRLSRLRESGDPDSTRVLDERSNGHAIATNGDGYAVISGDYAEMRAMLFDGEGQHLRTTQIKPATNPGTRDTAIASDGRDYFAVWGGSRGGLYGCTIHPDGTTETPLRIAATGLVPSVRHDGSRWEVTYITEPQYAEPSELLAVTIDGAEISTPVRIARGAGSASMADMPGKTVIAWSEYPSHRGATVRAARFEHGRIGTPWHPLSGAARQKLLKALDSRAGLTVLWTEQLGGEFSLHAGIRGPEGSWREIRLADDPSAAAIAFNGINHFVVWQRNGKTFGQWLTPDVEPVFANPVEIDLDFTIADMVWNAFGYTIVGRRGDAYGTINAARLTSSGTTVTSVTVQPRMWSGSAGPVAIATDDTQALIVWYHDVVHFLEAATPELYAIRYDDSLHPLGPRHLIGTSSWPNSVDARWDGSEYQIAWLGTSDLYRGGLTRDGIVRKVQPLTRLDHTVRYSDVSILPMRAAPSIVAWRVLPSGGLALSNSIDWSVWDLRHDIEGPPVLTRLGDSTPAVVASMVAPEHPYGSPRIFFLRLAKFESASIATPVLRHARSDGQRATLTWSVARADGITGYRIEQREGETWRELETWIGPDARSITIDAADGFRIRALSDHTTAYSNEVTAN